MPTPFEEEMQKSGVVPLNTPPFLTIQKKNPKTLPNRPKTATAIAELPSAPWRDSADDFPPSFAKSGVNHHSFKALKNTRHVDDCLDLHGYTIDEARSLLFEFLKTAQESGARRVLVIHGIGRSSENGFGVLRANTFAWLFQAENVLAYHNPAPLPLGSTGATVVLLKKKNPR